MGHLVFLKRTKGEMMIALRLGTEPNHRLAQRWVAAMRTLQRPLQDAHPHPLLLPLPRLSWIMAGWD